jgi:TfoX/Sxy family transcriptional regulator of competence genes
MPVTRVDIDRAIGPFSGLGGVTTRRMMGGFCLRHRGTILHPEGGPMP